MKRAMGLLLALCLALVPANVALAESIMGSNDWQVTFTDRAKMVDNYSEKEWADDMYQLQPGDDATFTVTLKHEHDTKADWYMSNEVIKSLEDARMGYATDTNDPKDSAYEYLLTYTNASGETRTLYDSQSVGGDSTQGLNEATEALEDFFYLDTLAKGQTAQVNLKVSLDGETEGNDYFDTLAQLKMKFAVELNDTEDTPNNKITNRTNTQIVRTGDDTNLLPLYIAMVVSGVLLAVLSVQGIRERQRERKEVMR